MTRIIVALASGEANSPNKKKKQFCYLEEYCGAPTEKAN